MKKKWYVAKGCAVKRKINKSIKFLREGEKFYLNYRDRIVTTAGLRTISITMAVGQAYGWHFGLISFSFTKCNCFYCYIDVRSKDTHTHTIYLTTTR